MMVPIQQTEIVATLLVTRMVIKYGYLNKKTLYKPALTIPNEAHPQKHLPVTTNYFEF
jgi:hypothetical protein